MECHVERTAEGVDQVTFLYTLANGSGYGYGLLVLVQYHWFKSKESQSANVYYSNR